LNKLEADLGHSTEEIHGDGNYLYIVRWEKEVAENPFPVQEYLFREQLAIASELNRSVTIHCVRAHAELLRILHAHGETEAVADSAGLAGAARGKKQGIRAYIFHSWGGPPACAEKLSQLLLPSRAFFSFQGDIVPTVAALWVDRHFPRPSPLAGEALDEWQRFKRMCASNNYLDSIRRLDVSVLMFESDAPDQEYRVPCSHAASAGARRLSDAETQDSGPDDTTDPWRLFQCYRAWSQRICNRLLLSEGAPGGEHEPAHIHGPAMIPEIAVATAIYRLLKPLGGRKEKRMPRTVAAHAQLVAPASIPASGTPAPAALGPPNWPSDEEILCDARILLDSSSHAFNAAFFWTAGGIE
jgi:hypothetical protein